MVPAIEIQGLHKSFSLGMSFRRKEILKGFDLTVPEGCVFGFLGPNGAGKTTTIKVLVGLVRATRGKAHLLGQPAGAPETMKNIGFLPENPYFYEYLTPEETLSFYGSLFGLRGKEKAGTVEILLQEFELTEIRKQRIKTFSKGMRQRLGMAQALIGRPRLVILDEPMSGLDPIQRYRIKASIQRLARGGITVFFSSHILADVEDLCDEIGLLVSGKITRRGSLQELLAEQERRFELAFEQVTQEAASQLLEKGLAGDFRGGQFLLEIPRQEDLGAAIEAVLAEGGLVAQVRPVRQSLEEYFVQEAGAQA